MQCLRLSTSARAPWWRMEVEECSGVTTTRKRSRANENSPARSRDLCVRSFPLLRHPRTHPLSPSQASLAVQPTISIDNHSTGLSATPVSSKLPQLQTRLSTNRAPSLRLRLRLTAARPSGITTNDPTPASNQPRVSSTAALATPSPPSDHSDPHQRYSCSFSTATI